MTFKSPTAFKIVNDRAVNLSHSSSLNMPPTIKHKVDTGMKFVSLFLCALLCVVFSMLGYAATTPPSMIAIETDYNDDGVLDLIIIKKLRIDVPYNMPLFFDEPDQVFYLQGSETGQFSSPIELDADAFYVSDFRLLNIYEGDFIDDESNELLIRTYGSTNNGGNYSGNRFALRNGTIQADDNFISTVVIKNLGESSSTANTYPAPQRSIEQPASSYVQQTLTSANDANNSVNAYQTFATEDRPLRLLNLADTHRIDSATGAKVYTPPPLIIITAHSINLNQPIEVVGSASDILFVATGTGTTPGQITCTDCSFKNVNRITFAVATSENGPITTSTSRIGSLTPSAGGRISITGDLKAPGALGVELIAQDIDISGKISTYQRVTRDLLDGYLNDESGVLNMAAGGVSIYLGGVVWDYDTQEVKRATMLSSTIDLRGEVEGAGFNLVSSRPVNLHTIIDSDADIRASVRYKNQTYIPSRSVSLVNLHNQEGISLRAEIVSGADVSIKAAKIQLNSKIKSVKTNLVAIHEIENRGEVHSKDIISDSGGFRNHGKLLGADNVRIKVQAHFGNNLGGYISASNVELISVNGLIQNGSRGTLYSLTPPPLSANVLRYGYPNTNGDGQYNTSLNTVTLGIGGGSQFFLNSSRALWSIERNQSAHILGDNITIQSLAFENINPYYELFSSTEPVVDPTFLNLNQSYDTPHFRNATAIRFDPKLENQVSVKAEKMLTIKSSAYTLNSSAVLGVSSSTGMMSISSDVLMNSRYLVEYGLNNFQELFVDVSSFDAFNPNTMGGNWWSYYYPFYFDFNASPGISEAYLSGNRYISLVSFFEDLNAGEPFDISPFNQRNYPNKEMYSDINYLTIAKSNFRTSAIAYSPPGRIFSMGNIELDINDTFDNKLSYFEVFGDANFNVRSLKDIGTVLESTTESSLKAKFSDITGAGPIITYSGSRFSRTYSNWGSLACINLFYWADTGLMLSQPMGYFYRSLLISAVSDSATDNYNICQHLDIYSGVIHSDRGSKYASENYTARPKELDSLFYINGNKTISLENNESLGDQVAEVYSNSSPLAAIFEEAVQDFGINYYEENPSRFNGARIAHTVVNDKPDFEDSSVVNNILLTGELNIDVTYFSLAQTNDPRNISYTPVTTIPHRIYVHDLLADYFEDHKERQLNVVNNNFDWTQIQ